MPRDSATCTMHNVKYSTRKWQSLRSHDCRYCWYAPFKGKLNLGLMFIFWGKRHCKNISVKQIASKASYSTTNIQHYAAVFSPCNIRHCLYNIVYISFIMINHDFLSCIAFMLVHEIFYLLYKINVMQGSVNKLSSTTWESEELPSHLYPVLMPLVFCQ